MLIILEGVDGSGKTTLANELSNTYNIPIVKFSYPKTKKDKTQMFYNYIKLMYENNFNLILDRSWVSELVYGDIMRNECVLNDMEIGILNYLVNIHKGTLIYCDIGKIQSFNSAKKRGEDYVTNFKTHYFLYEKYDEMLSTLDIKRKVTYNYMKGGLYENKIDKI